jgi:predicted permease
LAVSNYNAIFSYPMFRDLESAQTVFTGLAAHYDFLANVTRGSEADATRGVIVSGGYFNVLNLQPAVGRLIGPQDEESVDEAPVVVLSHDYWQNRFGGDPNVIGDTLTVNNRTLTIVGVAPEGFTGTMPGWRPAVFVPITMRWLMQPEEPRNEDNRASYWLYLFARLKPGVSLEQAAAELNGFYGAVLRNVEAPLLVGLPDDQRRQFVARQLTVDRGARGQTYTQARASHPLALLLGATMLVLLIACVNIANLLLARGASRAGEMAVRASIGASRGDLASQLVTESAVLAGIGGLLSLPVAWLTLRAIAAGGPAGIAGLFAAALSPAAVAFAALATLATVLLFGLVPALQASHTDPGRVIKGQGVQSLGGRGLVRFRSTLIGAQIALSMILLVLAGLFTRSLANVDRIDFGMDVDSLVGFSVSGVLGGYSGDRLDTLYESITNELAAEPGVVSVASTAIPLLNGLSVSATVAVVGSEQAAPEIAGAQSNYMTSPGFFRTLSIPLLVGRDFTAADSLGTQSVAIVNESFIRRFELGTDAIGKFVRFTGPYLPATDMEIVGVVGDAKYANVKGDIVPQFFTPRPRGDAAFSSQFFYVRAGIDADSLMRRIREVVAHVDPNLAVGNLATMRQRVDSSVALDRLMSTLSATFAGLATVLAGIGLYGVLAYNVGQRTRELGLRLALGASPAKLRTLVLRHIGRIAVIGGVVGLIGALALGRLAGSLLFGLSGYDPFVLVAAVTVLTAVVLAASWLPARRASNVAPIEALRYE